jgi:exopolyphosphatase/guanosine-5'-triphosphate,3'-diphosphate pyrophosphatase
LRVAAIDIGTNTVLLLIAEVGDDEGVVPIVERAEITRLGQGVDRARTLAPEAVERTLACLRDYAAEIAAHEVARLDVVGTSAMRDAAAATAGPGREFIERARALLGVAPRVISGDEEASLAFAGGVAGLGLSGEVTAFDIGGGSTEIIRGQLERGAAQVSKRQSVDMGSVRLFERHVRADPPSATEIAAVQAFVLDQLLPHAPPPAGQSLVGMAGTVTTVAAVARGIAPYDPAQIHGARLSLREIAETSRRLRQLPLAERKQLTGLEEKRADVIPIGAVILETIVGWAHADEIVVSDRGVRWGVALQLAKSLLTSAAKEGQRHGPVT